MKNINKILENNNKRDKYQVLSGKIKINYVIFPYFTSAKWEFRKNDW